ncbi:hypothetical protein OUZ56_018375 [Daphnia magna]|uniref:Uncharacterized protein n=1 Tax=Daphnia magna TaxID=35525 RepID=A0ABQ9Z8N3_9CRUS|nr:hypothetical protein OUZ56_018375 [Daphnia magna]
MAKINIYKDHVENKTLQFVLDMASNIHEESLCSDEGNSQEASKADVTDKEVKEKKETSWVHNYFTKLDGPDSDRSQY